MWGPGFPLACDQFDSSAYRRLGGAAGLAGRMMREPDDQNLAKRRAELQNRNLTAGFQFGL
jgi:hypothetical protein